LLGARGDKRLLTLDWDAEALRIVHVRIKRGDVRILQALLVPWTSDVDTASPHSIGAFIRRVLDQQRIRSARAIVDIPRDQAVVHTLHLPSSDPEELPSMVHFQIVKELPYALDEAVVDFVVEGEVEVDATGESTTPVLVAAVRNEVIAHYQSIIEAAGLTLERIGLRPHANLLALGRSTTQVANGRTLYVDVGPNLTEIDVIRHGQLVFSRAASVSVPVVVAEGQLGDGEVSPADGAIGQLLVEVTRSIEAYRASDPGAAIDRAVIGGSCGIEPGLAEAMKERFGFRASLYAPAGETAPSEAQAAGMTGFSATLGLALGQVNERMAYFDFLNPKRPEEVERARRRKVPMTAIVVLLFVSAAAVLYYQVAWPIKRDVRKLRDKINTEKKWAKDFGEFQGQLDVAETWAARDEIWLDELMRVVQVLPDHRDAYMDKITMNTGRIQLDLRVSQAAVKDALIERLKTLTLDSEVEGVEGDESKKKPRYRLETGDFSSGGDPPFKFRGPVTLYLTEYETEDKDEGKKKKTSRSRN